MAGARDQGSPDLDPRVVSRAAGVPWRSLPWWAPVTALVVSLTARTLGPSGDTGSLVSALVTASAVVVMLVGTWRRTSGPRWARCYDTTVTSVWWSLGLSLVHGCLLGVVAATVGFESPWGDALLVATGVHLVWPVVALAVGVPAMLLGGIALLARVAARSVGGDRVVAIGVVVIVAGLALLIGGGAVDAVTAAESRDGATRGLLPLLVDAWTRPGPGPMTVRAGSITALAGIVTMLLGFRVPPRAGDVTPAAAPPP
ncbi:hypothetical protein [Cellulomonas iranensis]|uniref:Uncharacterized protein n=1 Tax=Cellulomonas iranensis TaxID=76862 RepID=A0ABU0GHJ0_9CELL|nr:hypothetical protein [Cellulomonas iranensis]MDQ0424057.1 hypothetical protein [Cellulomonas iranensis]